MFLTNKLLTIKKAIDKIILLPENADKIFGYISKIICATRDAVVVTKGSVDLVEAIACQDGICAVVSAVCVAADGLQICTAFMRGPNVTAIVKMLVYMGCKWLVCCCKRSKLSWGGC